MPCWSNTSENKKVEMTTIQLCFYKISQTSSCQLVRKEMLHPQPSIPSTKFPVRAAQSAASVFRMWERKNGWRMRTHDCTARSESELGQQSDLHVQMEIWNRTRPWALVLWVTEDTLTCRWRPWRHVVVTRMPGESYRRQVRSLLSCSCYVFRVQMEALKTCCSYTNARWELP